MINLLLTLLAVLFSLLLPTALHADQRAASHVKSLEASFANPSNTTRPGVWWRWIDGNVTREGITRDLTEMARQGIRSVDVFDVGGGVPTGPAAMMGTQWRELFKHTLAEAARLGIEVRVVAAAGWGMGGPWVDAAHAAKKLDYAEIQVDGPRRLSATLPKPPGAQPFYQDVAVIAFREKANSPVRPARMVASSEVGNYCTDERNWPADNLSDGDPDTCWKPKAAPSVENPNPHRPRAFGGKGAEGVKKGFPISNPSSAKPSHRERPCDPPALTSCISSRSIWRIQGKWRWPRPSSGGPCASAASRRALTENPSTSSA